MTYKRTVRIYGKTITETVTITPKKPEDEFTALICPREILIHEILIHGKILDDDAPADPPESLRLN